MTRGDLPLDERLERIEAKQDHMLQTQVQILVEMSALKTRAGFWGGVGGIVAGALAARFLG